MKIFIFDDGCAYFGSANITGAAIGRRASGNRNNEAGILVWGPMMEAPLRHFEKVWNDPDSLKHTWKRFATMAKELDKELKEKEERGKMLSTFLYSYKPLEVCIHTQNALS